MMAPQDSEMAGCPSLVSAKESFVVGFHVPSHGLANEPILRYSCLSVCFVEYLAIPNHERVFLWGLMSFGG